MQAPLSSTASGHPLRTRPLPGLPLSTPSSSPQRGSKADHQELEQTGALCGLQAWPYAAAPSPRTPFAVAEGAGLAHDAGNLLGALRLYCDLLARPGVLREEHRHYADELQLISQRSRTLVDRLLNPAATAGWKSAGVASVSVPLVIEQCRGLLSTVARRAVEVVYGAGAEIPVPVSRESIERILVNLTKNAAEASAAGGAITLRVTCLRGAERPVRAEKRRAPNRIVLSIEDHGRGMNMAAVKVLLDGNGGSAVAMEEQPQQLHGLDLVSGNTQGRGLGLRVVRELVEASGGELRLRSRSGCGTTVEIAWAVTAQQSEAAQENGQGGPQLLSAVCGAKEQKGRVSC